MLSILYGVISALSWGAADFAGGLVTRKLSVYRSVFYGNVLGLFVLFCAVLIYPEKIPESQSFIFAGLAGIIGAIGMLALFYSMAHGLMSLAAPVSALFAAGLPVLFGAYTQGLPTMIQFIGFGWSLLAVWLISRGYTKHRNNFNCLSKLRVAVLAGLGFGCYFILMNYAVIGVQSLIWPMIACYSTGTLTSFTFVIARRESFSVQREVWFLVFVNVVFNVAGIFFYILALKSGRLDISALLSSQYPCGTVILACWILKERIYLEQWFGIISALIAIIFFTV